MVDDHRLVDDGTTPQSPDNDMDDDQKRPWSDLPFELLSLIAKRLRLIELLGFRGVCKGWRSASSTASAEIESGKDFQLSFIVHSDEDKKSSLYYHTCENLYSNINIPELQEAACLASNQGWLLLFQQGSLFFFCPFSRARIDLPQFPDSDLSNHIAAISAPPTSPECIVFVANRCRDSKVQLHVLRRGATLWTKHEHNLRVDELVIITGAVYSEEECSFNIMDSFRTLLKFSVKEENWVKYRIVDLPKERHANSTTELLPFYRYANFFRDNKPVTWLGLEADVSISTCGIVFTAKERVFCLQNEKIGNGNPNSQLKGIWIQARFLHVPPNQGWSL